MGQSAVETNLMNKSEMWSSTPMNQGSGWKHYNLHFLLRIMWKIKTKFAPLLGGHLTAISKQPQT